MTERKGFSLRFVCDPFTSLPFAAVALDNKRHDVVFENDALNIKRILFNSTCENTHRITFLLRTCDNKRVLFFKTSREHIYIEEEEEEDNADRHAMVL